MVIVCFHFFKEEFVIFLNRVSLLPQITVRLFGSPEWDFLDQSSHHLMLAQLSKTVIITFTLSASTNFQRDAINQGSHFFWPSRNSLGSSDRSHRRQNYPTSPPDSTSSIRSQVRVHSLGDTTLQL